MFKSIKKVDSFGQFITLRYEKKIKHPTILGGFCTILLFGVFLGYFVLTLSFMWTFQKLQIRNSISGYFDENLKNTYKDIGLDYVFSVNFTDGNIIPFSELKTYLRIYVQQNENEEYDLVECKKENLLVNNQNPIFQEKEFALMQTYGQLNLCVDPNFYKKIFINGMKSYFSFKVEKCQISLRNRIECKPPELLEQFLKNIYLYSYNFEIKKDLSQKEQKNFIFTNDINKYNGKYLTQQAIEYKQQLDFNTYDIQDSFIYLQNATTEQGQYFTVKQTQVVAVKSDPLQLLQVNVYYSGQQNNQVRTCYNLQNALNDTFSVIGSLFAFLSAFLFEFQQILFGFKIILNIFEIKIRNALTGQKIRLNLCNKIFLVSYFITSKFLPCFKCCFSFRFLSKRKQRLIYFFKKAKNNYEKIVDLGNIIQDIQQMKKFIYEYSQNHINYRGFENYRHNIEWKKIDLDIPSDEMEAALYEDQNNVQEDEQQSIDEYQIRPDDNQRESELQDIAQIRIQPVDNQTQISQRNYINSGQKLRRNSINSDQ